MSDIKMARRLEALTKWANWAAQQNFPVPSESDLELIAVQPQGWRDRIQSPAAQAWENTIDYVLNQQKFGVVADEIVRSLPDELIHPKGSAVVENSTPSEEGAAGKHRQPSTNAPDDGTGSDPVVEALVAWRSRRIEDGADGADSIKVTTLRNLVKFGYTDGETISKKLPGQAAYLGGEVAEIIASFARSATRVANPGETPPPSAAPAVSAPAQPTSPAQSINYTRESPRTGRVGMLNLSHDDFCEYRYERPGSDESNTVTTPRSIRVTPIEGGVRLSFDAFVPDAGKMVIYRVVAGDGSSPRKPEAGDLVGATTGLEVEDRRGLRAAVRAYQVWCHVGLDEEDAARNNPFLLAKGHEVSPVFDFEIHIGEGRISGEWTVFPGVQRVRVYRIPMDGAAALNDPQHEICRNESNIEGFTDLAATPGLRYLYRACAEVAVEGTTQLSRPVEEELTVPVKLAPVEDLSISPSKHAPDRVDLAWSPPSFGKVRVYWSSTRPRADIGQQQELTRAQLSIVDGFREENRVKGPTNRHEDGRDRLAAVEWPSDWPRIYVTPVTALGEQVRVGATRVVTRPLPPVSNAEIVERYDTEMVKFGWPAEAASVLVYLGSTTMPPEEIVDRNRPVDDISRSRYERDGGITFEQRLEPKGCTVVLVPVNFSQREAVRGQLTALRYPGLHRIEYQLEKFQREHPARYLTRLHLKNSLDIDSAIALTMVNRTDRLPLSPNDGEPVYFIPPDGGEPTPQCLIQELKRGQHATDWCADWTVKRGYFRLFISSQADQMKKYALADPSVRDLYLRLDLAPPGVSQ